MHSGNRLRKLSYLGCRFLEPLSQLLFVTLECVDTVLPCAKCIVAGEHLLVQLNEFCLKGVFLRRIIGRGQRPEYKRDCAASPPRTP